MGTDTILWIVLAVTIGTVLALDLLVFNRRAHAPSFAFALIVTALVVRPETLTVDGET